MHLSGILSIQPNTCIGGQQLLFNTFMLPTIPTEPDASKVLFMIPLQSPTLLPFDARMRYVKSCIQVNGFSVMDGILSRKKMKGDGKDILPSVSVRCHFNFCSPEFQEWNGEPDYSVLSQWLCSVTVCNVHYIP